jgi:hypothetical protein
VPPSGKQVLNSPDPTVTGEDELRWLHRDDRDDVVQILGDLDVPNRRIARS